MLMVIGTRDVISLISRNQIPVEGFGGICPDSAIRDTSRGGSFPYGDHFQWFIENCSPGRPAARGSRKEYVFVFQWMDSGRQTETGKQRCDCPRLVGMDAALF